MSHFEIEQKIWNKIYQDNKCSSHFEYEKDISTGKYILKLITYNPKNLAVFLAYESKGKDKLEVTRNILNMIEQTNNQDVYQYSLIWKKSSKNTPATKPLKDMTDTDNITTYTSIFKAKNIGQLLDKFHFQEHDYEILEIKKLNI